MKLLKILLTFFCFLIVVSCKTDKQNTILAKNKIINEQTKSVIVKPINHGTLVLESTDFTLYIDPVGGAEKFLDEGKAHFILITDIHGDHLNIKTLEDLDLSNATLIAPKAVVEKLPKTIAKTIVTLNNDESFSPDGISIEAIPMYNLRKEALKFHPKGRGNGYIITVDNQRIYISGDTEDITEMRNLKNIDIAFVCMNLPYTMTETSAASAVLDFKPRQVYPYHYRGTDGFSDINTFKTMIESENTEIKVILLDWYK